MITLFLSKLRNLVYYRSIDERPRVTYIHVVRGVRKEAIELIKTMDIESKEAGLLKKVIESINPKIKTEECTEYILVTLKGILDEYEQ